MGFLALMIALGIILSFAYWSRSHSLKSQRRQKAKVSKVYPISKSKRPTNLRRIK